MLSGSLILMLKCGVHPISPAFSFIISAKFSSEPAILQQVQHMHVTEAIIIPLSKFSTETWSLIIINIEEYPAA